MSLTRSMLTAMGIEGEKLDEILNAHLETVNGLKDKADTLKTELDAAQKSVEQYKAEASKVAGLQEELEKLQATSDEPNPFESKYNDLKAESDKLRAEYDQYKADVEAKETTAKKRDAYRSLLKEAGVSDKRLDAVLKVADFGSLDFNKDGSVKEADKLRESIKTEWADFIEHEGTQGADVATPPANNGGATQTRDQVMSIKNTADRQKAMIENHEAFGF